jgi:hypothetical protein
MHVLLDWFKKKKKPRGINMCCERSIEYPQRACNSLNHHKMFWKHQCTKKKSSVVTVNIFRIGLYQGHRQVCTECDLIGYDKCSTIMSIVTMPMWHSLDHS